ncbi:MAG TPA: hypothetical protein VFQ79_20940 [Bryobacteraceae bacterium]|nr:hypothetical protein [Bryobacteraceae bacterium]
MILKASQRGGGRQLALHLLNAKENEHVHVHELRGFTADDLEGAFKEAYAVSRATKAKQFLFSLSLNPPPNERVSVDAFESAVDAVEKKLGLEGQPRAIVFHEKDGRRHAHAVWSRIDAAHMRAINLPFFKTKLRDVARELFLEHGWQMPRGFIDSRERDPASYTLAEWQQAKRGGHDPKALKAMLRELWASSDSAKAFAAALRSRGYTLARGDRRGFVAVDYRGEVYAVARYTGQKTKDVRKRLGDDKALPSVDQAKLDHAARMTDMLRRHIRDVEERRKRETANSFERRRETIQRQRTERDALKKRLEERQAQEARERAARFSKGLRGLWHRMTGKHSKIRKQNEQEALLSHQRDRAERERLIHRQLDERRPLHQQIKRARASHAKQIEELHRDIADFARTGKEPPKMREQFREAHGPQERVRPRGRDRGREPDFER